MAGMRWNCCDGTTFVLLLVHHCLGSEHNSIACLICGRVGQGWGSSLVDVGDGDGERLSSDDSSMLLSAFQCLPIPLIAAIMSMGNGEDVVQGARCCLPLLSPDGKAFAWGRPLCGCPLLDDMTLSTLLSLCSLALSNSMLLLRSLSSSTLLLPSAFAPLPSPHCHCTATPETVFIFFEFISWCLPYVSLDRSERDREGGVLWWWDTGEDPVKGCQGSWLRASCLASIVHHHRTARSLPCCARFSSGSLAQARASPARVHLSSACCNGQGG